MKLDFGVSYKYTVYYYHINSYMLISWKILKTRAVIAVAKFSIPGLPSPGILLSWT